MNKLWDDLKDNMKEWGVSAVEKAEEISRVAVAKGEEFTKISKLKFDILQLQKDKNKLYEKLGLLVYKKTNESNVCLLYTSPSPRDLSTSRMPSSA